MGKGGFVRSRPLESQAVHAFPFARVLRRPSDNRKEERYGLLLTASKQKPALAPSRQGSGTCHLCLVCVLFPYTCGDLGVEPRVSSGLQPCSFLPLSSVPCPVVSSQDQIYVRFSVVLGEFMSNLDNSWIPNKFENIEFHPSIS